MNLSDFAKGDRVILSRVLNADCIGKTGTVRKTVRRSREVVIDVDGVDPESTLAIYRAYPENIDKVQS